MKTTKSKKLRNTMIVFGLLVAIATITYFWISSTENQKKEAHIANAMKIISAAEVKEANGWDFTEEGLNVYEALELGNLTDPWEKKEYKTAIIYKNAGGFGVELVPQNGKCAIDDLKNSLLTYGIRLCN